MIQQKLDYVEQVKSRLFFSKQKDAVKSLLTNRDPMRRKWGLTVEQLTHVSLGQRLQRVALCFPRLRIPRCGTLPRGHSYSPLPRDSRCNDRPIRFWKEGRKPHDGQHSPKQNSELIARWLNKCEWSEQEKSQWNRLIRDSQWCGFYWRIKWMDDSLKHLIS